MKYIGGLLNLIKKPLKIIITEFDPFQVFLGKLYNNIIILGFISNKTKL